MTIHELSNQIKRVGERLNPRECYTILLILLVGFGSFGLGRLSRLQESKSPILMEQTLSASVAAVSSVAPSSLFTGNDTSGVSPVKGRLSEGNNPVAPGGALVASKGGTKYHFPWCSGAQRISEANKIWFGSVEEARKAGYTPAGNCKGLK